jgi:hypothetical protein
MTSNDDERREPKAGDRVGLGRVVRDHDAAAGSRPPADVEEASSESFPASDPPAFAPGRPTPPDGGTPAGEPELPNPRDVP